MKLSSRTTKAQIKFEYEYLWEQFRRASERISKLEGDVFFFQQQAAAEKKLKIEKQSKIEELMNVGPLGVVERADYNRLLKLKSALNDVLFCDVLLRKQV